jgi:hypothetical protein
MKLNNIFFIHARYFLRPKTGKIPSCLGATRKLSKVDLDNPAASSLENMSMLSSYKKVRDLGEGRPMKGR